VSSVTEPLVSVIMPAFQSGRFIGEALESVFAQTYERIEVFIADGGSTDDTTAVVEDFSRRHPGQVTLIRGEPGSGVCARRAIALERSQGELVAWLDSDDVWEPAKTEKEVRLLAEHPEVGVVYSYFTAIDADSGSALAWEDGRHDREGDLLEALFVEGCFIGALTTLFRREAMATRGLRLRTKDFAYGDDLYLWLSLSLDWRFARIPEVLARYRRHADNQSDRAGNSEQRRVALLREFLDEFPDAKGRLGRSARRRGLAGGYRGAARMEGSRGRRLRALGFRLAAAGYGSGAALARDNGAGLPAPG
jgi:glycosyltransferase involved in cell wall biosynthesis